MTRLACKQRFDESNIVNKSTWAVVAMLFLCYSALVHYYDSTLSQKELQCTRSRSTISLDCE